MAGQQRITTPFATPEDAAKALGVSKTRTDRLIRWAREFDKGAVTKAKADGSDGKIVIGKLASKRAQ